MRTKPERAQVSRAEKRKVRRTSPWEEVKVSGLEPILKLQFRQKADLQGRVTKVTPGRASPPGKIHPLKEMLRLVEAKANAPEPTLKLHSHRKARLQEKVLQNEEMLFPEELKHFGGPQLTRKRGTSVPSL